ncbi:MAG: 2-succinyl-5-enolpyruvyl-6-hydroxy-3-cyclohexene-1-carboxylic-acid synthase [Paramuribaculum sp.]|nr:2-succinyl-5-enolpyruvyl-6-hydroxy-3-cyclohexene-1-carboxylic-acid synthase [Paramuribaculum sp.]
MPLNTINYSSRCIVDVLQSAGVEEVVACPGSRNTPLLIALSRCQELKTTVVVDERTAGFVALGKSLVSGAPVAVVCTSGTALLNFAPSVAEAYYRKIPLIVISADRPVEWIDQDDSQTIRQFGAFQNFVKKSYDIPSRVEGDAKWYVNRILNDAVMSSKMQPYGPVHINVQIPEPIGLLEEIPDSQERMIRLVAPAAELDDVDVKQLAAELVPPRRIMIIAGFSAPDKALNGALRKLSQLPNVVVLTETLANLRGDDFISEIDATLSVLSEDEREDLAPDIVISFGGALVSRMVKQYIRDKKPDQHWHVGRSLTTVDCFKSLTIRIELEPRSFLCQLVTVLGRADLMSDFRRRWLVVRDSARSLHQACISRAPWSDLKAFSVIIPAIPRNYNLQLSNGTPVRYAQLFGEYSFHRSDCNRGVSGIDGSTSTALGAMTAYGTAPTLLITGDMSAQYDVGALGSGLLTPGFKMIVMCNGGGGIFHFIKSTRDLDIVETCFDSPCVFPAEALSNAYGLRYFEATDELSLRTSLPVFFAEKERAAMLAVMTDGEVSGRVLRDYFSQKRK